MKKFKNVAFGYEAILPQLNTSKELSTQHVIHMEEYCENPKQAVSVRAHRPTHLGTYHTHDFFEINYVYRGSCINLIEENTITMQEGDIVIIHPGAFHILYADKNSDVFNFLVDKDCFIKELKRAISCSSPLYKFINKAGKESFHKFILLPSKNGRSSLSSKIATQLIEASTSDSPWRNLLQESLMLNLIFTLGTECNNATLSETRGESTEKMINILSYITENYATVTLDDIAKKFSYSKTHICRMFNATGKSFRQILTDIRLTRAMSYLKNTDMTVGDVANIVGFDNVEYFHRLFKKQLGLTPLQYRNKK